MGRTGLVENLGFTSDSSEVPLEKFMSETGFRRLFQLDWIE